MQFPNQERFLTNFERRQSVIHFDNSFELFIVVSYRVCYLKISEFKADVMPRTWEGEAGG